MGHICLNRIKHILFSWEVYPGMLGPFGLLAEEIGPSLWHMCGWVAENEIEIDWMLTKTHLIQIPPSFSLKLSSSAAACQTGLAKSGWLQEQEEERTGWAGFPASCDIRWRT